MRTETARKLGQWPQWLQQTKDKTAITFGGLAFVSQPELKELVPGIYLGDTIQEGRDKITKILG